MRFILGLDLRPLCAGAVRVARWLSAGSPHGEESVAVHVLEEQHLLALLRYHHFEDVERSARTAAQAILSAEQAAAPVEVLQGPSVEQVLEAARLRHGADGMIIGRAAGVEGKGVVRLGRSARRILRTAAAPVIVVPPDLDPQTLGTGPLLALTSLRPDAVEACRFAQTLAKRLGRPWSLVHVAPVPEEFAPPYLPVASLEGMRRDFRVQAEKALPEWSAAHGLQPDESEVVQGRILDSALAFARVHRCPLIVAGSERLSTLERTLIPSIGSELAASAPVPVAVVPPAPGNGSATARTPR